MQKRFLVVALAVLGLLVLVSFWQASEPPARVKPLKPSELPLDGEPLAGSRPLEARLQDKPLDSSITELPRELPPPPPAPVVENDPAKGRIWLRRIDARSNRPLADARCEVWRLPGNEGWYQRHVVGHRITDANGLMSFTTTVVESTDDEDYDSEKWDTCFFLGAL